MRDSDLNTSSGRSAYQTKYGKANLDGHLQRIAEEDIGGKTKASNGEESPFDGEVEKSKLKASMNKTQGNNQNNSWLSGHVPEPTADNYTSISEKVGTPNVSKDEKKNDDDDDDDDDEAPDLFN